MYQLIQLVQCSILFGASFKHENFLKLPAFKHYLAVKNGNDNSTYFLVGCVQNLDFSKAKIQTLSPVYLHNFRKTSENSESLYSLQGYFFQ